MFGGIVFLLHGKMLVGVWKDSLILRLGRCRPRQPCWTHTPSHSTLPASR
jgi:hypothetical protein